jgi:predicted metal-dependent hydrolase
MQSIQLGNIDIEVVLKDIKNVHLSVYPPNGRVRIAAPLHLDMDTIRIYSISKLAWIKRQQAKLKKQKREAPRLFINRESHYFAGKRYMLKIVATTGKHQIILKPRAIEMHVHTVTSLENRQKLMDDFYRTHLKAISAPLIEKWQKSLNVKVKAFGIKRMSTKWGTCNEKAGRIWLNLELAKKPVEYLEYVILHELVHLKERKHNERFVAYLDKHMPNWRHLKEELNRLGV